MIVAYVGVRLFDDPAPKTSEKSSPLDLERMQKELKNKRDELNTDFRATFNRQKK